MNVLWSLVNLVAGYLLFRAGNVATGNAPPLVVFFAGIALISTLMSIRFAGKHTR